VNIVFSAGIFKEIISSARSLSGFFPHGAVLRSTGLLFPDMGRYHHREIFYTAWDGPYEQNNV
jgi:hypothetical protein